MVAHLDIHYVKMHNKSNAFRKAKISHNLQWKSSLVIRKGKRDEDYMTICLGLSFYIAKTLDVVRQKNYCKRYRKSQTSHELLESLACTVHFPVAGINQCDTGQCLVRLGWFGL